MPNAKCEDMKERIAIDHSKIYEERLEASFGGESTLDVIHLENCENCFSEYSSKIARGSEEKPTHISQEISELTAIFRN